MATKLVISTLTCPVCRRQRTHAMPTDACVIVAQCRSCGHIMRPKPGDCCVFCSYGDVPCPPIQQDGDAPPVA
jgi:Zn ribbon nucleic-acid-binding protein